MANEDEAQRTPRFLEKLSDQDREEFADLVKKQVIELLAKGLVEKQITELIEKDPYLGKNLREAVNSEAVFLAMDKLVEKTGDSREDLLLKALTLYEVVTDAISKGQRLALLTQDYRFVREIIGLVNPKSEAARRASVAG
jgi:hypothetical protein